MSSTGSQEIAEAWRDGAEALAEKFDREWVIRRDVWGGYLPIALRPEKQRADGSTYTQAAVTKPAKARRGLVALTREVIRRHCNGNDSGDIIGLHSVGPDNTSIRFACEVDAHDGQPCNPEANWKAALRLNHYFRSIGLDVLLTDSNGKGGYHVQGTLETPIPTPKLHAFLADAVARHAEPDVKIEIFPKQRELTTQKKCGNWLRLPGRHHTRDHWTRVWNGSDWLEGKDAVDAILRLKPNPVHLLPEIAEPEASPEPKAIRASHRCNRREDRDVALRALKLIRNTNLHFDDWLAVGQALHSVDPSASMMNAWIDWSRQSGKHVDGECERRWPTFDQNGGIKLGTLIHMARQHDLEFPRSKATGEEDGGGEDPITKAIEAKDIKKLYAAVPQIAKLPFADVAMRKAELKDAFGQELNLNDFQRSVTEARRTHRRQQRKPRRRDAGANLPNICVTNRQLRDITDDSLCAFAEANDPPVSYMRSGELVHLKTDEKRRYVIKSMSEAALRGRLERSANYFSLSKDEEEIIEPPPLEVCKDVLALSINEELERVGKPPLPPLEGIVESPVLRRDGTILTTPGYDPDTSLYFAPTADLDGVKVPMSPTSDDVRSAVSLLDEVVGEFPFEDQASAANAKAALLSPFIRHAIVGRVPVAIFDKPQPGTGGSLLAEAIETIATGREVTMWGRPGDDDEWRKLITSILREGHAMAIIDNVEEVLESDSFARVVTCSEWGDRILGESREIRLPARTTWFVTGNNVQLGRNLARRCYQIRMNAKVSRPERRKGFKHPNLVPWIRENRGCILGAVLTICRAWYAAGKREAQTPVLGSFENWSRTIGGILAHAGIAGFLGNLEDMHAAADEEHPQWEAFLLAWEAVYGNRAITLADLEKEIPDRQQLRESLPSELSPLIEHVPARHFDRETYRIHPRFKLRLGKALQKRTDMRFGDSNIYVSRAGEHSDKKVALWRCLRGVRGVPGSVSSYAGTGGTLRDQRDDVQNGYVQTSDGPYDSPALPRLPGTPEDLDDEWREYFNERAAVMEFEGGLSEDEARKLAFEETLRVIQNRNGRPAQWPVHQAITGEANGEVENA